ncbi:hypothetical protein D7X55_17970 [Corallococcus sp. AB049A]|nr:hypothetical protein D7X55_17970 [Corallococcus sp. AB049A]
MGCTGDCAGVPMGFLPSVSVTSVTVALPWGWMGAFDVTTGMGSGSGGEDSLVLRRRGLLRTGCEGVRSSSESD